MAVKLLILMLVVVVGLISNSTSDDIAKRLKKRYDNIKGKCSSHGKQKPAYQCSGIMLRVVSNNLKVGWDMKPLNVQKDSFSFSFLRRDQTFSSCAYNYDSGFIIYPHLKTPKKKNTYKVYCSFPFDAGTDARQGRHACGKYNGELISGHCDEQNVKSFTTWKSHFKNNFGTRQCAFDMTKKSAAKYFDISLKVHRHIQKHFPQFVPQHNELKMHAWSVRKPKNIPIEAFFYLEGSANGKRLAEKNQDEFYTRGGGKVPIVGIRLPTPKKKFKVTNYRRTPRKRK